MLRVTLVGIKIITF